MDMNPIDYGTISTSCVTFLPEFTYRTATGYLLYEQISAVSTMLFAGLVLLHMNSMCMMD